MCASFTTCTQCWFTCIQMMHLLQQHNSTQVKKCVRKKCSNTFLAVRTPILRSNANIFVRPILTNDQRVRECVPTPVLKVGTFESCPVFERINLQFWKYSVRTFRTACTCCDPTVRHTTAFWNVRDRAFAEHWAIQIVNGHLDSHTVIQTSTGLCHNGIAIQ